MIKTEVKNTLEKHNLRPNKRLGQSFLIDKGTLEKIIKTADLSKEDIILEIGAGLGNLTQELAKKVKKVITLEKDKQFIPVLKENLKDFENIEIIQGDILKTKLDLPQSYKVVANIPYYLTSPLLRMLLGSENQPKEITLLIQKEVAQRIIAQPPKTNLLAVSIQFYAKPKIVSYVSRECFWPKPEVDSTIIKMTEIKKPKEINIKKFFKLVKAGFSSPRKQLANNLSSKLKIDREEIKKALLELGLGQKIRAEGLKIEDWVNLVRKI